MRRLQAAGLLTATADWAADLALSIYAFERGGPAAVGLMALVITLPTAPVTPLLGWLSDRFPRRTILLVTNAARAVMLGSVGVLVAGSAPLATIYTAAAAFSIITPAYYQAHDSLLPSLAETPADLSSGHAATSMFADLGFLVGSLAGGALVAITSVATVLGCVAALYAMTLVPLAGVPSGVPSGRDRGEHLWRTLAAGFVLVAADGRLRIVAILAASLSLVSAATDVLIVVVALETLHGDGTTAGVISAAWAAGAIVGGAVVLGPLMHGRVTTGMLRGALLVFVALAALGKAPNVWFAIALVAVVGTGHGGLTVAVENQMQRLTPDHVLGRVAGVTSTVDVFMSAVGGFGTGVLCSAIGVQFAVVAVSIVLPLVVGILWIALRAFDSPAPTPALAYAQLRQDPIFAPLPLMVVERLARETRVIRPDEGTTIVTQGEVGEQYFLVIQGSVQAHRSGFPQRILGPGEGFGEAALLTGRPNVATVTAGAGVDLLVLDRDSFLEVVLRHPYSLRVAQARAESFLLSSS